MFALVRTPSGLWLTTSNRALWVVDVRTGEKRVVAGHETESGSFDGPALNGARFNEVSGIAVNAALRCVYVTDCGSHV